MAQVAFGLNQFLYAMNSNRILPPASNPLAAPTEMSKIQDSISLTLNHSQSRVTPSFLLAGTVLTAMEIPMDNFDKVIRNLWNPQFSMTIRVIAENLFLFCFSNIDDFQWVLNNGPCNFLRRLIALKPVNSAEDVNRSIFTDADFWVQVHGLPFNFLTSAAGFEIRRSLGRVLVVDAGDESGYGFLFLRIRWQFQSRDL